MFIICRIPLPFFPTMLHCYVWYVSSMMEAIIKEFFYDSVFFFFSWDFWILFFLDGFFFQGWFLRFFLLLSFLGVGITDHKFWMIVNFWGIFYSLSGWVITTKSFFFVWKRYESFKQSCGLEELRSESYIHSWPLLMRWNTPKCRGPFGCKLVIPCALFASCLFF